MAKWTYSLTVINNTDRTLELISSSVPWGKCDGNFPNSIVSGGHGEFKVYSPAGNPTGLEFYFTMCDKPNAAQEPRYGSFSVAVDVPYWKHENTSSFDCQGVLTQSGFKKIPNGAHDFATTAAVSTTLCSTEQTKNAGYSDSEHTNLEVEGILQSGYCNLYDWNTLQKVEVINLEEKSVDDFIPEKNIFSQRKMVGRTGNISVPKTMWNQIIDHKFPDTYSKKHFVKDYITVSAYEIRKNTTISIAANQSYEKTLEITNRSTVRRETREEFQIENTISAGGTYEDFTLSETLRMQYQISRLDEYCNENMKSVREVFNYISIEQDRDVVLWDLVEVLALYRENVKGQIELVGVGDYYITATQKTYIDGNGDKEGPDNNNLEYSDNLNHIDNLYMADDETICQLVEEGILNAPLHLGAIQGSITINRNNYRWMEVNFGTNRGMLFNPGNHRYEFKPNPHNDPWYNKHQSRWYSDMATQFQKVGNRNNWGVNDWDDTINNLTVNSTHYRATEK